METNLQTSNYQTLLEEGLKFQDFVTMELMRRGVLTILCFRSQQYQYRVGESANGVEIKLDKRFRQTGNLYIEIAERTSTDKQFSPSGIHRPDNTWLWVIGDYKTLYIFAKNILQLVQKRFIPVITATSKGYLMPVGDAKKLAAKIIEVKK